MDKPFYLGFVVLELSQLLLYETYYEKLQPYYGQDILQLDYIDCDRFELSTKTENIIKDLKKLRGHISFL